MQHDPKLRIKKTNAQLSRFLHRPRATVKAAGRALREEPCGAVPKSGNRFPHRTRDKTGTRFPTRISGNLLWTESAHNATLRIIT
jgi:hypothetical protein